MDPGDGQRPLLPTSSVVVGFGSIGRRHARLLVERGPVTVVTSQAIHEFPSHPSIPEALRARSYALAVIASPTSRHLDDLALLAASGHAGPVLVEKPLADHALPPGPAPRSGVAIGYVLRQHPAVVSLRERIGAADALTATFRSSSFLPAWRPDRDHRTTSSASVADGGGVLRDLSHELDLLQHLLGPVTAVVAARCGGGSLGIETDAAWSILARTARCAVVDLRLSYLDRVPRRAIEIVTATESVHLDLVASTLTTTAGTIEHTVEIDDLHRRQHTAALAGDSRRLCSWAEAASVMSVIDAIERSVERNGWVDVER